jgi:hypothetical protein
MIVIYNDIPTKICYRMIGDALDPFLINAVGEIVYGPKERWLPIDVHEARETAARLFEDRYVSLDEGHWIAVASTYDELMKRVSVIFENLIADVMTCNAERVKNYQRALAAEAKLENLRVSVKILRDMMV